MYFGFGAEGLSSEWKITAFIIPQGTGSSLKANFLSVIEEGTPVKNFQESELADKFQAIY